MHRLDNFIAIDTKACESTLRSVSPDAILLLEELSHRVSNELTAAICLVSTSAATIEDKQARLELHKLNDCLLGFARVHRALVVPAADRPIDATRYWRELCEQIAVSRLEPRGIKLDFSCASIRLGSVASWRVGLIIAELLSNSFRHAFHEKKGKIWVRIEKRSRKLYCCVRDDGVAQSLTSPDRGLRILRALASCLDGTLDHRCSRTGTLCVLTIPAYAGSNSRENAASLSTLLPPAPRLRQRNESP